MARSVVILCSLFFCAFAQAQAPERQEDAASVLAAEIIKKSGAEEEVRQFGENWKKSIEQGIAQAQQSMAAQGQPTEPAKLKLLRRALAGAFDAQSILDNARKHFETDLSSADMAQVIHWLDSPLGKKITELEHMPEDQDPDLQEGRAEALLAQAENPDLRKALIAQLLEVSGMVEQGTAIVKNLQVAMMLALFATAAPDQLSLESIRQHAETSAHSLHGVITRQMWISTVITYKDLDDSELGQYIGFFRSQAGSRYLQSSFKALNEAFIELGRKSGEEIGRLLHQTVACIKARIPSRRALLAA